MVDEIGIEAVLRATITDFKARMAEARHEMDLTQAKADESGGKLASLGKGLTLGLAGAAVAVGVASVKMADTFEASHARLTASLSAAGISWNSVKDSVSQTDAAATKYGYTSAQVEGALGLGVISTQNYEKAHRNLAVAIELAKAKHMDLSDAMLMVDRAATGQLRPLKAMGIDLPVVATTAEKLSKANDAVATAQQKVNDLIAMGADKAAFGTKAHAAYAAAVAKLQAAHKSLSDQQSTSNQILDALTKRLGGQAAASADTFGGRIAAAKAEGENMGVSIGMVLIPKLEVLMTDTQKTVEWFGKHKDIAKALAIALGSVGAVLVGAYGSQAFKNLTSTVKDSVKSVGDLVGKITGSTSEVEGDLEGQGSAATTAATDLDSATTSMSGSMTTLQGDVSAAVAAINTDLGSTGAAATAAVAEANTAFASLTSESVKGAIGPIDETLTLNGTTAGDEIRTAMTSAGTVVAGDITTALDTAGTTAAGELSAAVDAAGGVAAGELGTAMDAAGTVAGGELSAGEVSGGKVAAEEIAAAERAAGGTVVGGGKGSEPNPTSTVEGDAAAAGGAYGAGRIFKSPIPKIPGGLPGYLLAGGVLLGGDNGPMGGSQNAQADLPGILKQYGMGDPNKLNKSDTGKLDRLLSDIEGQKGQFQGTKIAGGEGGPLAAMITNALKHLGAPPPPAGVSGPLGQASSIHVKGETLTAMQAHLAALTAQYGANSPQARAALRGIITTEEKWLPNTAHLQNLKPIDTKIGGQMVHLAALDARAHHLASEGSLTDTKAKISGDLGKLHGLQSLLSKEETSGASRKAIDATKAEMSKTREAMDKAKEHLDAIKSNAADITKTKDALHHSQMVGAAITKVNTDTTELRDQIKGAVQAQLGNIAGYSRSVDAHLGNDGIVIKRLPTPADIRATGNLKLVLK